MGLSYLIFFAVGYWTAGLVIFTERVLLRRIPSSFNRKLLKIALLDLLVALVVLIFRFGGR